MDENLLDAYRDELNFLRNTSKVFAQKHPDMASRLSLHEEQVKDPFIERLLEGVAFIAARTRCRLQDEQERLAQDLIASSMPDVLNPLAPATIVCLQPLANLLQNDVHNVPADSPLRCIVKSDEWHFRTCASIELKPLKSKILPQVSPSQQALVLTQASQRFGWFGPSSPSILRLKISTLGLQALGQSLPTKLRLYGATQHGPALLNWLTSDVHSLLFVTPDGQVVARHTFARMNRVGWQDDEAMTPVHLHGSSAARLLREWKHFPERFLFAELHGWPQAVLQYQGTELELWWLSPKVDVVLWPVPHEDALRLFCTTAVNRRTVQCEPIRVMSHFTEYEPRLPVSIAKIHAWLSIEQVKYLNTEGEWRTLTPTLSGITRHVIPGKAPNHYKVRKSESSELGDAASNSWRLVPDGICQDGELLQVSAMVTQTNTHLMETQGLPQWQLDASSAVLQVRSIGASVHRMHPALCALPLLQVWGWSLRRLHAMKPQPAAEALGLWLCAHGMDKEAAEIETLQLRYDERVVPLRTVSQFARGPILTLEVGEMTAQDVMTPLWLFILTAALLQWESDYVFLHCELCHRGKLITQATVWA